MNSVGWNLSFPDAYHQRENSLLLAKDMKNKQNAIEFNLRFKEGDQWGLSVFGKEEDTPSAVRIWIWLLWWLLQSCENNLFLIRTIA